MSIASIASRLVDSSRFNTLFKEAGKSWSKRGLTNEDRVRMLDPIVEMVLSLNVVDTRIDDPRKAERIATEQAIREMPPAPLATPEQIQKLGFDPFKQPDVIVDKRASHLERLQSWIPPDTALGATINIITPPDWPVNDADAYLKQLGYVKMPTADGNFGARPAGDGKWQLTIRRVK